MKIILRVGSVDYVLASDLERSLGVHYGPTSLRGNMPVATQDKALLDAEFAEPVSRGNAARRFSFGSEVEFATLSEAQLYALQYPQTLPREGKLRIEMKDADGQVTTKEITKAVIEDITYAQEGVSVTFNYQVKGGGLGNVTAD